MLSIVLILLKTIKIKKSKMNLKKHSIHKKLKCKKNCLNYWKIIKKFKNTNMSQIQNIAQNNKNLCQKLNKSFKLQKSIKLFNFPEDKLNHHTH